MHCKTRNTSPKFESDHGETVWELSGKAAGGTCYQSVAYASLAPKAETQKHYHPEAKDRPGHNPDIGCYKFGKKVGIK